MLRRRLNAILRNLDAYLKDRAAIGLRRSHELQQSKADSAVADIERLKDAHWTFTEREAQFRQLLDSQDHLIVRRNGDGRIVFANTAFCRMFDLSPAESAGGAFEPRVLASEIEHSSISSLGKPCRSVVELVSSAGGPRWVHWERQNIIAADRSQQQLSVGRDVTKERAREDALRDARDRAEAANRAKSRFLATMSHEIRTPMNGILGMAGLLCETEQNDEQESYTAAITSSAQALLAVIDEILDFSSIEAGKLRLADKPFLLSKCISDVMALMAPRARGKGIGLELAFEAETADAVRGDEDRLRQILLNLLSNAIKFTDSGRVCLSASSRDAGIAAANADVVITVSDTGIGFNEAESLQLFDEFEQTQAAVGRAEGGTGLGLAISKRLANAMGGDITAAGKPGQGATFTVALRLKRCAGVAAEASAKGAAASAELHSLPRPAHPHISQTPTKPRVLIAEDNDINALLARRVVEKTGCEAIVVTDGRAAAAAVAHAVAKLGPNFDLVLMDLYMPCLDGLTATRTILGFETTLGVNKSDLPPIVALTANAFAEDRLRCLGAGMVDYLAKPFDASQLATLLERWVYENQGRGGQKFSEQTPYPAA